MLWFITTGTFLWRWKCSTIQSCFFQRDFFQNPYFSGTTFSNFSYVKNSSLFSGTRLKIFEKNQNAKAIGEKLKTNGYVHLFIYIMWLGRLQILICEPQSIWHKLLVLSWLYVFQKFRQEFVKKALESLTNSDPNSVKIGIPVGKVDGFRYCRKASQNCFSFLN